MLFNLVLLQVSDFQFDAQRKTFHTQGYAEDPTAYAETVGTVYVGEKEKAAENDGRTVFEENKEKLKKRKREHMGDPSDPEGYKGLFFNLFYVTYSYASNQLLDRGYRNEKDIKSNIEIKRWLMGIGTHSYHVQLGG